MSRVVFAGLYFSGDVGGDCVDAEYVLVLPAYPCKAAEKGPDDWVCVSLAVYIRNVAISENEHSIGDQRNRERGYVSIR